MFDFITTSPFYDTRRSLLFSPPREYAAPDEDGPASITLDVPGFTEEEIQVEAVGNLLTIKGESEKRGTFRRRYKLSGVDTEAIEARLAHGVLTVQVPLAEEAKPKQIAISST
jgi:HSP20 family molecular chaperone IbpA